MSRIVCFLPMAGSIRRDDLFFCSRRFFDCFPLDDLGYFLFIRINRRKMKVNIRKTHVFHPKIRFVELFSEKAV